MSRLISRKQHNHIIGKRVRYLREERGISQEQLAADCEFFRTYIYLIETAKTSPSAYTLYKIAKALKIEIGELYPTSV